MKLIVTGLTNPNSFQEISHRGQNNKVCCAWKNIFQTPWAPEASKWLEIKTQGLFGLQPIQRSMMVSSEWKLTILILLVVKQTPKGKHFVSYTIV